MRSFSIWLILCCFGLVACRLPVDLEAPPEIRYGEDICEQCQMIISEERFAASYVTPEGEVHLFDGIGEMLAYERAHPEPVHIYWVHDYTSHIWLNADEAIFVLQEDLQTPMGWGIVAFSTMVDAERFVADQGGVVTSYKILQSQSKNGELKRP